MASQEVRQRPIGEPTTTASSENTTTTTTNKSRRAQKMAMAKRGLKSLTVAVAAPLTLTILTHYLFGSTRGYTEAAAKPFWHPPLWAFHLASLSTSCLMGLAAWLVWAEGGFHRQPVALALYLAQLLLGLMWPSLVFGLGATPAGLAVCVAHLAALFGCLQCFRRVNPTAGDLIKPCLAWVSFLAVFNYKLV